MTTTATTFSKVILFLDGVMSQVSNRDLAAIRSDVLNTVSALLAKFTPATIAGVPFGIGAGGAPSPPPNQPLLTAMWLLLQWEAPTFALHLQRGGGVSMLLGHACLSLLATVASPAAFLRLAELAMWDTSAGGPGAMAAVPSCHAALLLCALLLTHQPALMALPPEALHGALSELRVASVLDAERLHRHARRLAASCPATLRAALDASWCARKPVAPPYPCAWLVASEMEAAGGGSTTSSLGRCWVIDVRSQVALSKCPPPP